MNRHQSINGAKAGPSAYAMHHDKPEEHEETKEKFDEDISLEEALSTL